MTLPANLRINVSVPFPSLVKGAGHIAVQKSNGIWTISPAYNLLGQIINPNNAQKLVVIYDTVTGQYNTLTLAALLGSAASRTQRSITSAGNLPIVPSDSILNINAVADLAPSVPLATQRNGAPLTFKNLPSSHTQTLFRSGGDTFDGAISLQLTAGSAVTLTPYNDGVNTGWFVE